MLSVHLSLGKSKNSDAADRKNRARKRGLSHLEDHKSEREERALRSSTAA